MKKLAVFALMVAFNMNAFSQDVKTVQLEQTNGEFTSK